MSSTVVTRVLRCSRTALLAVLFIAARETQAQILDADADGLSDIWELNYATTVSDTDLDSDEDGMADRLEAVAGTDPFNVRSVPRLSQLTVTTNGVQARMVGVLGKRYELQASEAVCGSNATNWFTVASLVTRTNPVITFTTSADLPAKFFRMIVSDVDTDGDGLNDWEEYQLGLDPLSANSSGALESNGRPLADYSYATKLLKLTPAKSSSTAGGGTHAIVIYPAAAGTPTGAGLTGQYFTNSSSIYSNSANFNPANLFRTTNDATINFVWSPATVPNLSNGFYTVRWTGQVEPQYSETYVFETRTDDGLKLWVNDQLLIDRWQNQGSTTWNNVITLVAGVRYNIRMEYFNRSGSARAQLYWYSPSQARQIIPALRLYPSSDGYVPGAVTSPLTAVAFLGQPFSYTINGANTPLGFGATNLPPGLGFNPANGVISGTPTLAGNFDIAISVSNIVGTSQSTLALQVFDTGNAVTREVWLGVPGTSVRDIPVGLPASQTNTLGTLEGVTDFGDNYGERVRGHITAPVTGNYYFWIAANNTAELWISNDDEPANKVRRASVSTATTARQWNLQPSQRSPWLALEAGKRYYIEILHKAGNGANDHWSVGWLQDPTGTNTVPTAVVPGFVLSPFVEVPPSAIPGTLYSANMVAQAGALSSGVGSATLRLSADESQAVLRFSHSGLSTPVTAKHIHADTYLGKNSQGQIVFDIDTATPEPDGSYIWQITPSGPLTAADLVEIIKQGKSYINIHTVNYPAGEINGHFTLAAGSPTFTPPPPQPTWTDDHSSSNGAARFLLQATFGSSAAEIKNVNSLGYDGWINQQFSLPISSHLADVLNRVTANPDSQYDSTLTFNTWWRHSVTAPDQLRQRVAFALSEILVVSESGPLEGNPRALSGYYDVLLKHAFGNFRNLLKDVTLSPAMGLYLDMRRNDKGNLALGTHPNENYAREILQLFSIGLNRMWPDGTLVLNSQGDLVPTYDQDVIIGFSRVFTGWNYYQPNQASGRLPNNWNPGADYINSMVLVPTHHELGTKRLLDNVVLPAARGPQADSTTISYDAYGLQDLELALDSIFFNENVGPFICRQLIQRLVTSHPSRDYLYRVVQKFNNNGAGVRGDMSAVIKAILLDYEARSSNLLTTPTFGKLREPLLRATSIARAFPAPSPLAAKFSQKGSQLITITTANPHRLSSSDDVYLNFASTAKKPGPTSRIYNNVAVTGESTFTINAQGIAAGTYIQSGNTITVTNSGHGLAAGYQLYLYFTTKGPKKGVYTVASVINSSVFTVTSSKSGTSSGTLLFPKWTGGDFEQEGTTITFNTGGPHGLKAKKNVYIAFPAGSPSSNGVYRIASVPTLNSFTVTSAVSADYPDSGHIVLPLVAPPLKGSGVLEIQYSTWSMNYTDSGSSASLNQTPLNSPTVFNFFFPDYKFPGILSAAGLTTPEFQLTSDTSTVFQMNFFSSAVFNNSSNTNGLSSFIGGNGAIMLDFGPWMTPAYTSDAGIPGLVDALNSLLCGGQLAPASKNLIVSYVANSRFPYTTPTATQMRDRVRAVIHLIVTSPDYAIQR